ncbi:MAG: SAM hydroxide adenosyltransferase, partial [Gammaproteobacteria bacterium]
AHTVQYCTTFSEVAAGRLAVIEDAYRRIAVVVNRGNAEQRLEAHRGDHVILARAPKPAS